MLAPQFTESRRRLDDKQLKPANIITSMRFKKNTYSLDAHWYFCFSLISLHVLIHSIETCRPLM